MSYFKLIARSLQKWIVEFAVAIVVVVAVVVLYQYFSQFDGPKSSSQEVWGQFGDFVGGTLNPILGFVSVLVLVATLGLQRKELSEARETARENNNILAEQLKVMHAQSLESTFFKMVDEIKGDSFFKAASGDEATKGIQLAVYACTFKDKDTWGGKEHQERNNFFRQMARRAVNYGEVKYVVLEKIVGLVEIASHLNNNQIHYALLQAAIGPRLLSAMIQLAHHEDDEKYQILLGAKRLLKNINVALVYSETVARDFWDGEQYEKFLKQKDSNLENMSVSFSQYMLELKNQS
ncbi:hypothetical protein ACSVIJ_15480 [Pseudomonas sp. NCHU5208]|uniref:hypothetical protein n=1 Tax=unclassified Pseudomonas TaxID=196821 RepID=UPI003F97748B